MGNDAVYTDDFIEEILALYSNMVYRLALTRTKSKADADDIYQEVFLRFVKKKRHFENEEHRKAWFIKVTINCSRKFFTSAWYRHTVPFEGIAFETKEKSEIFYAVKSLPLKYRTVIYLFYYEDLPISKIAETLSLKESTVKSQLHRARHSLKLILEGEAQYGF